jgi:hypothetical protein
MEIIQGNLLLCLFLQAPEPNLFRHNVACTAERDGIVSFSQFFFFRDISVPYIYWMALFTAFFY